MTTVESVRPTQSPEADTASGYASLRGMIEQAGLLNRQPRYYAVQVALTVGGLAAGVFAILVVNSLALLLVDAVFLAVVFTNMGFMVHDAGHRQIFESVRKNDWLALFFGWLLGMSPSWWIANHNMHHNKPNDLDYDPHTAIPTMAFSKEQAAAKQGSLRNITRFQAFYFFPLLSLESFGARLAGVQFISRGVARYPVIEALGMSVHLTAYVLLLAFVMTVPQAIIFAVVHQSLAGLYMGSVFAPNHKGMPVLKSDTELDYLHRQVITTRNMNPHPITDFWCGGLNYQIEHHLFPTLPRNKLKSARNIVKRYCEQNDVPYHEVGFFESYVEVMRHLYQVAEPLRQTTPEKSKA